MEVSGVRPARRNQQAALGQPLAAAPTANSTALAFLAPAEF